VKSCVIYLTKKNKILAASQTVATARIMPKICQGQPQTLVSHYWAQIFTINRLINLFLDYVPYNEIVKQTAKSYSSTQNGFFGTLWHNTRCV